MKMQGGKLKAMEDAARYNRETTTMLSRMDQSHKRQYDGRHADSNRGGAGNLMSLDYGDYSKSKPGNTMMRGKAPSRLHPSSSSSGTFNASAAAKRTRASFDLEWAGDMSRERRPHSAMDTTTDINQHYNYNHSSSSVQAYKAARHGDRRDGGLTNQYPLRNQPTDLDAHIHQRLSFSGDKFNNVSRGRPERSQPSQTKVIHQRSSRLDGVTFRTGGSEHDNRKVEHRFNVATLRNTRSSF